MKNKIPSKIKLFSAGPNETTKGTFIYNPELSTAILESSLRSHSKFPIDVAHLSLSDMTGNPDAHISVGWFDLEVSKDGIFANNIEWTPRGESYLENKEFRYISPAFQTNENNEIVFIENFALTNSPATYNAELMLSNKNTGDTVNNKKELLKILIEVDQQHTTEAKVEEEEGNTKELSNMSKTKQEDKELEQLETTTEEDTSIVVDIVDSEEEDNNTADPSSNMTEDPTSEDDSNVEDALLENSEDMFANMTPEEMHAALVEKHNLVLSLEEQVRMLTEELAAYKEKEQAAEKETMLSSIVNLTSSEKEFYLKTLSKEQIGELVKIRTEVVSTASNVNDEEEVHQEEEEETPVVVSEPVIKTEKKTFLSKNSPTASKTNSTTNNKKSTVPALRPEVEQKIIALAAAISKKR